MEVPVHVLQASTSARMRNQRRLLFCELAQAITTKVNLAEFIVAPVDMVSITFHANLSEILGIADRFENLTSSYDSTQINDAFITVIPDKFQHALHYRFGDRDS